MQLNCFLIDVDYITQEGRAIIRMWLKDNDGKNIVAYDSKFEPYFYAITDDETEILSVEVLRNDEEIRPTRAEKVKKQDFGTPIEVMKVYVNHPQHVPLLREQVAGLGIEVREADILYAIRYIIDRQLIPMDKVLIEGAEREDVNFDVAVDVQNIKAVPEGKNPDLKVMAFDCEMMSHGGLPDPKKDPIIIISIATGRDELKCIKMDDEKNDGPVISDFIAFIEDYDPDVIVGYNTDEFDWQYLKSRADKFKQPLKIGRDGSSVKFSSGGGVKEARIFGRSNVDLYKIAKRDVGEVSIKKLENVAEYMGIMRKSERIEVPGWGHGAVLGRQHPEKNAL